MGSARRTEEERCFGGLVGRLLLQYVETAFGPAALTGVCRRAGETRPIAVLQRDDTWSSHTQLRRLAAAVAELAGGAEALVEAGAAVWRSGVEPALGDTLQLLGSPAAVFEMFHSVAAQIEPLTETQATRLGDGDWVVRVRFPPELPPFREHCAFASGLFGQLPTVFGHGDADVVEETCQVDGAPACTFHIRWDAASVTPVDTRVAELDVRARVLEARIRALEATVNELVSGETTEVVLERVVEHATRALPARGFVLTLDGAPEAGTRTFFEGISEDEALACAAALHRGEVDPRWTVVDISSRRARHGRLVALHSRPFDLPHQQMVLHAYGRVAAAALDSAAVMGEARRQAQMATALLRLSQSLAEIGTTDEMATRLAAAVPSVIDCDQVVITLFQPEDRTARVAAVHGFGEERDRHMLGAVVPVDEELLSLENVRILRRGGDLTRTELRVLGEAAVVAGVPVHADGRILGWIATMVRDNPERLVGDRLLEERLRGLAGQAATAMRNAELVDQIRHQAEHDPLTGLCNQRRLALHAEHAVDRARRDGSRVGLLFLDLDDFKRVNDTLGHDQGDDLLRQVAGRLEGALRQADTVARFGGDEFVVLLHDLTDDGTSVMAKITEALRESFPLAGGEVHVASSIGAAAFPDDGDSFGELLKQADIRMYAAKQARRVAVAGRR